MVAVFHLSWRVLFLFLTSRVGTWLTMRLRILRVICGRVFLPVFTFPLVLSRRVSVPACIYFSSCFVQTCQCSCLYLLFLLFCPDVSVLLPLFAPDPHWVLGIDIWKRDKLMSNHTTCRADLPSCSLMTGANALVFMQCESTESWSAKQTLIL